MVLAHKAVTLGTRGRTLHRFNLNALGKGGIIVFLPACIALIKEHQSIH